ncbi:hypothetical protein PVAP13_5KG241514 [Panicum virgatum]|uniref:Protein FAR1-RELATED SEQUENCE n=1 Tax=Panicum virgatum TaxID=38727 RepID=A0A8T0SNH1_PANVG|nr:hypothetical protein PVAP13_5KG241514 [Panicum virgatum]
MSDLESLLEYSQIVSRLFASEDEGFQFYNAYGLKKGFSVRRSYVEWDAGHNEMTLRMFVCSREGFHEEKHMNMENKQRRPRGITRVGWRAKFVIARERNTGQWYVKDFIDEHNHPLAPEDLSCLLRSHRRISDEQKVDILEMEISGIHKYQIFEIQEMQYGGDLYNLCHRHKQGTIATGDAQTVIRHLRERERRDADFFFSSFTDDQGHLVAFGDVIVSDSTYKTNRYNLPLVPFVGVNHHKRTIVFGCGIISHENTNSFEWLLRTFSDANIQKHPISRAIRIVWPNTSHRLCGWHIEQNLVRNIHDDKVKEAFRIERKWRAFLTKNEVSKESWLYQMYECYLGLRSNQRSESMNARLQMQLDGKMTLLEMVEHYETCLSRVHRNEADDDIKALQSEPFTAPNASILEIDAKKRFTPNVFVLCHLIEILDGDDTKEYIVGRKDKGDIMTYVKCDFTVEGNLKGVSCSCQRKLPDCCVSERKSTMYEYSTTLLSYHDLRNISRAASFKASRSTKGYERLKGALLQEVGKMYGPVLPQAPKADCEDIRDRGSQEKS